MYLVTQNFDIRWIIFQCYEVEFKIKFILKNYWQKYYANRHKMKMFKIRSFSQMQVKN